MSEINLSEQEIVSLDKETEEKKNNPEVVELEWTEVKSIVMGQTRLAQLDQELATLLVQTEKTKLELINTQNQLKHVIIEKASQLKDAKGIDPNLTYELKLPADTGEKGYFIKNQEQ